MTSFAPAVSQGQAHRCLERAVMGIKVVPLLADYDEFAGLVGGHQQRCAQLPQQSGDVWRVASPQRPRVFHLGNGCRNGEGNLLGHDFTTCVQGIRECA